MKPYHNLDVASGAHLQANTLKRPVFASLAAFERCSRTDLRVFVLGATEVTGDMMTPMALESTNWFTTHPPVRMKGVLFGD